MNTKKKFMERLEEVYSYLKPDIAIDILVYTPEELDSLKDSSFLKHALMEGRILYER